MRDLKQRLFDLLRSGGISVGDNNNSTSNTNSSSSNSNNNHSNGISHSQHQQQQQQQLYAPTTKPKKLHEYTAADCNAAFLRKYHDLSISREREREREQERHRDANAGSNVIYFNENLSMTSKYNVRQFPLARYPSCPLSSFDMAPQRVDGSAGSSLAEEEDTESDRYNFCSDEDQSSNAHTLKLRYHKMRMDSDAEADVDADVHLDDEHAESQLDSFCTLCTSTFSYNKCCRYCDNSLCGSKCNSERGSHASRLSCNRNTYTAGLDADLESHTQPTHHHPHPHQHQQQQRLGGSMKLLAAQTPTAVTAAAIRYVYIYI